jgi:hypothetical protein
MLGSGGMVHMVNFVLSAIPNFFMACKNISNNREEANNQRLLQASRRSGSKMAATRMGVDANYAKQTQIFPMASLPWTTKHERQYDKEDVVQGGGMRSLPYC